MPQAKFSLDQEQLSFLERHQDLGFRDKSSMVRLAVSRLQMDLELRELQESATLYSQLYPDDSESKTWVEGVLSEWPE